MASNKARAYFTLSGYHFDPDDITRLLGIEPTSVDASGARSPLDKPVISSWELSTETMTDDIDVYKMTDIIIKKIEPAKEKILQVIKSHNLSPRIGVVLVLSVEKSEIGPDVGSAPERFVFWLILALLLMWITSFLSVSKLLTLI